MATTGGGVKVASPEPAFCRKVPGTNACTGSTYVQKRLRVAPDLLRRHVIYVPVLGVVASMMGNAKAHPYSAPTNNHHILS